MPTAMTDTDEIYQLKTAVQKLNTVQKKIFLTYSELGTYTETAKKYGVSTPTIKKYINEIRSKIFKNI